jgi:putative Mn2+ efflux pump MntP
VSDRAEVIAPVAYVVIDITVIVAPALAVRFAAERGGLGDAKDLDLVVASGILACVHALMAWTRLRSEERSARHKADSWIAAVDALVVLALGATLLPVVVLWGFADEHASIANRGYPVVALWVGVQLVAITLAELTGRAVFWWLERSDGPLDRGT